VRPGIDEDGFLAFVRAGARGCLAGNVSQGELTRAIRAVHSGGVMFDARCGGWAVEQLVKPAVDKPFPELTEREYEVLELVADGRATTAIARDLGLSVKTVRNYLSRIFAKLHLADRAQAAVHARRAGLGH
jgi:DNA-binding NarL/FixJ family response regulator